jgi:DNA-binding NarL/FixJ family response regulator
VTPGDAPIAAQYRARVDVAALVDDLMDQSRVRAALPGTRFVRDVAALGAADVVIIDLARHADVVRTIREQSPTVRIVGFGRHDNPALLDRAQRDGANAVLARSRFFHDPAAAVVAGDAPT